MSDDQIEILEKGYEKLVHELKFGGEYKWETFSKNLNHYGDFIRTCQNMINLCVEKNESVQR